MKYNIISGMSQMAYRRVPSDESLLLTTPKQESIQAYLSQIGYDKFPEFVRDILVKIEGHIPIDITDGPGDEKQDLLTLNREGKRCLIQCKHTINHASNYSGDDLDKMVTACIRKDCREAIFITNGNLTPQAKRYINDEEYSRGWPKEAGPLVVSYWNGTTIWDKIQGSSDILNKWFSGMGQTHGMRGFKFDVTIQKLPYVKGTNSENHDGIITELVKKSVLTESESKMYYYGEIEGSIELNVKKWFQFSGNLDINYLPPHEEGDFIYKPLYALTVDVVINNKYPFSPRDIRLQVLRHLLDACLEPLPNGEWWHITASQNISFVHLHDIREPRKLVLDSAETFVKVGSNPLISELDHCTLGTAFEILGDADEDEFRHKDSGITVIQFFDQQINPIEHYHHQVIQQHKLQSLSDHIFHAAEKINEKLMMRVRAILPPTWFALQHNSDNIIWCYPPDSSEEQVELIHKKIEVLGVHVLQVRTEDIPGIINNVTVSTSPALSMYQATMDRLSFPVDLESRMIWLSKYLVLPASLTLEQGADLLMLKYGYEEASGYNNMGSDTEMRSHSSELPNLAFDVMSIRGKRMIDIAIQTNPLWIVGRYRQGRIENSNQITLEAIKDFQSALEEVYSKLGLSPDLLI